MAEVTYNFNAPIINNGTLNGDIVNPVYNCNGRVDIPAQDRDELIKLAILKMIDSGMMRYKNDWQILVYVLIEFCGWENSASASFAKLESLGLTNEDKCAFPCNFNSLRKDFICANMATLQKYSTLDKANSDKYQLAKTFKEELENSGLIQK